MFTRKSISLIAVLAALGAFGVAAASAWATEVTPAGTRVKATLSAGAESSFTPENGAAPVSVNCRASDAEVLTPAPGDNEAPGSVTMGVLTETEAGAARQPVSFTECALVEGTTTLAPVAVTTNATNGNWSVAAWGLTEAEGLAFIAVPSDGASIEVAGGCTLTVSPGESTAVGATYTNATGELAVGGQLYFTDSPAGCSGFNLENPAMFTGNYTVNEGFEILP